MPIKGPGCQVFKGTFSARSFSLPFQNMYIPENVMLLSLTTQQLTPYCYQLGFAKLVFQKKSMQALCLGGMILQFINPWFLISEIV